MTKDLRDALMRVDDALWALLRDTDIPDDLPDDLDDLLDKADDLFLMIHDRV